MLSIFSKINEVLTGGIIGVATENNETETPVAENKVTSVDRVNSENTVEVGGAIAVEEAVVPVEASEEEEAVVPVEASEEEEAAVPVEASAEEEAAVPVEASAELTAKETENEAAADACAEVKSDVRSAAKKNSPSRKMVKGRVVKPIISAFPNRASLKPRTVTAKVRSSSNEAIANVSEASVSTRIFDISTFEAEVKSDVRSAAKEISLSRKMVKGSVVKSIISAVKKLIECEDESYIISKAEYDEVISTVLEMVRNNVPYQVALDGLVQRLCETH